MNADRDAVRNATVTPGGITGVASEGSGAETAGMLGTITRIAFMRVLPRKLIPLLTAWEVFRLIRGRQANRGTPVDNAGTGRRTRFGRR